MYFSRAIFLTILVFSMGLDSALALNDPTRPPGYPVSAARGHSVVGPAWHVSIIKIASKHKTAVINGRLVAIGQRVNGATVIDIEPSRVKLKKANKEFLVRLFSNSVKKITRVPVK